MAARIASVGWQGVLAVTVMAVLALASIATAQETGPLASASTSLSFKRLARDGDPQSDCFYLATGSTDPSVEAGDIRVTPCLHSAAGTVVTATSDDMARPTSLETLSLSFADLNGDAHYSFGDAVYADTDPSPGLAAPSGASYSLRLTPFGSLPAGRVVAATDTDAQQFGGSTMALDGSFGFVDGGSDPDFQGAFNAWDASYLLAGHGAGFPAGQPVPALAIRLSSSSFGSQVPSGGSSASDGATSSSTGPAAGTEGSGPSSNLSSNSSSQSPSDWQAADGVSGAPQGTPGTDSPPTVDGNETSQMDNGTAVGLALGEGGDPGAMQEARQTHATSWLNQRTTIPSGLVAPLAVAMAAIALRRRL